MSYFLAVGLGFLTNPPSSKSHKFGITSISFYPPDHGLFITSSYDGLVNAWDTTLLTPAHTFTLATPIHAAAMAPKSFHTLIATTSQLPHIRILDLNTGAATHSLVGHTSGGTLGIGWSPRDEYILASGGVDGTVRLWDVRRAVSCLACLDMGNGGRAKKDSRNIAHEGSVNGVRWSEDGALLVTLGMDGKMRTWDMATGRNMMVCIIYLPRPRKRCNDYVFRHHRPTLMLSSATAITSSSPRSSRPSACLNHNSYSRYPGLKSLDLT